MKKSPWRIVVFLFSLTYIVFLWTKKDIAAMVAAMPKEDVLPLIVTTVGVSLLKVAAIAGFVLLVKWLIQKRK